jgi:8-oxo-dGTP pyrophosphatase MutT (NUDIX family)
MLRQDHLSSLLTAYQPSDPRQRVFRARMLSLLAETDAPFSRKQFQPGHITTSAFITDPSQRELLLIRHKRFGIWLQPGGHIELEDPDVCAAVRREIAEEVGISQLAPLLPGIFDLDLHAIPARSDELAHEHFDVRFLFEAARDAVIAGSDADTARWVPLSLLLTAAGDESVRRVAERLAAGVV